MAGLNTQGLYLDSTTSAAASANITTGHWRLFTKTTGAYVVNHLGQEFKLNSLEDAITYTDSISSALHAVDLNLQSQIDSLGGSAAGYVSLSTDQEISGNKEFQNTLILNSITPFSVPVGATLITNLDADLLDGQHGAYYTGYTDAASAALQTQIDNIGSTLTSQYVTLGTDQEISGNKEVLNTLTFNATVPFAVNVGSVKVDNLDADMIDGYHATSFVNVTGDQSIAGNKTFTNNVSINGDLYVYGTTTTVSSQELVVFDNIIVVNDGEAGAGVTRGFAGISVDRGSEPSYEFLFDEARDSFVLGASGGPLGGIAEYQVVATREDSPTQSGVPYWNGNNPSVTGNNQFRTSATFKYISGLGLQVDEIVYSPSTPSDWNVSPTGTFSALNELAQRVESVENNTTNLNGTFVSLTTNQEISGSKEFQNTVDFNSITPFSVPVGATLITNLDADLLDGQHGAYYTGYTDAASAALQTQIDNIGSTLTSQYVTLGTDQEISGNKQVLNTLTFNASSPFTVVSGSTLVTNLDADKLDGKHYSDIVADITGSTAPLSAAIISLNNSLAVVLNGSVICDTTNYRYSISHTNVNVNSTFPVVTLNVPTSASVLYIQGITNRSATGFDVVLSDVPSTSGYSLNWQMPQAGSTATVRQFGVTSYGVGDTSITPDASVSDVFDITCGNNAVTLNSPVNMANGQTIKIQINPPVSQTSYSFTPNIAYKVSNGPITGTTRTLLTITRIGTDYVTVIANTIA